jgi:hypothetical protein
MEDARPSLIERRSGLDRRALQLDDPSPDAARPGRPWPAARGEAARSRLAAPFRLAPEVRLLRVRDPWVSLVRRSLDDYAAGRLETLWQSWDEQLTWSVVAPWPAAAARGPEAVAAYHQRLAHASGGTFEQRIEALDGSNGPIVDAHVRTTARIGDRRLDLPTLLTFELVAMRVRRVTEIPGDPVVWERFWAG